MASVGDNIRTLHSQLTERGVDCTLEWNSGGLMLRRYENQKLLRAGKHPKGNAKRTKAQDVKFANALEKVLNGSH